MVRNQVRTPPTPTPESDTEAKGMISNHQRRVRVSLRPLERFLDRIRCELRFPPYSVAVRLVSDTTMAQLNRAYRGKSGPTDVLSFPANGRRKRRGRPRTAEFEREAREEDYIGDIAIAPRVALRNAHHFSRRLPVELRILILHGMLHLAGYDHEADQGQMDRIERRLRRRFGLVGP